MRTIRSATASLALATIGIAPALAQSQTPSTAQSLRGHFASINRKVLEMAKDFPENKYGYRMKPEMRSFGEVIVHITSGNVYAAKAGRGENVNWDELDPKKLQDQSGNRGADGKSDRRCRGHA